MKKKEWKYEKIPEKYREKAFDSIQEKYKSETSRLYYRRLRERYERDNESLSPREYVDYKSHIKRVEKLEHRIEIIKRDYPEFCV